MREFPVMLPAGIEKSIKSNRIWAVRDNRNRMRSLLGYFLDGATPAINHNGLDTIHMNGYSLPTTSQKACNPLTRIFFYLKNKINAKGELLMKKLSCAVFLFVISVSIYPLNPASAQTGGYMGVFGGYTLSSDVSTSHYDHDYYYRGGYDIDVEETWVLGFKLGYTPAPLKFASFEFEYSYLNPDLDRSAAPYADAGYTKIEGDATFHNFMLNAIAKYPVRKIHPYVGAGFGFSYIDASVSATSTARSTSNDDDTVFAWQLLVGVEMELTNNLSMDIGYRFFATESESDYDHYHEYYNTYLDYEASIVTFGLIYKF
jgi:opacity protein-like surface antigen